MARVTVEDCVDKVPNRFHLVQMTAIRAKQLKRGAQPLVSGDTNKEVVTAQREIAELLGVTTRTVQRDWVKARAWLYRELYGDDRRPATP